MVRGEVFSQEKALSSSASHKEKVTMAPQQHWGKGMWGVQYENLKQIFWFFPLSYVLYIENFLFVHCFFYEEETAAMTDKK